MEPFLPESILEMLRSYGPREFDRLTQVRVAATVRPSGAVEPYASDALAVESKEPSKWPVPKLDAETTWASKTAPPLITQDVGFAASSINPYALAQGAKTTTDIERFFDVPWRELLAPRSSPLWSIPNKVAQNHATKVTSGGRCQTPPRWCPWEPPDPTPSGFVDGRHATFRWSAAGAFMPGDVVDWFDPVQGSVPNCHFIAALQALAMTMPNLFATRAVNIGGGRRQFRLFDGVRWTMFDIDETVPVAQPDGQSYSLAMCAASSRGDEDQIVGRVVGWPGVYEKAFAVAGLGNVSDHPQLLLPSYWVPSEFDSAGLPAGRPVAPITALTGQPQAAISIRDGTLADLLRTVQSLCNAGGMVTTPAHLATRGVDTADQWARAQLVPDHAYSLCGWIARDGRNYVVLRNAWGAYQPNGDGTVTGSWRGRPLGQRGLFALEISRAYEWFARLYHMGG